MQFRPATDDVAAITGICRRLDGIPLAIELAAAHVAALPAAEIEARLKDRFHLLAGSRTTVARQRALEAAIDWSYQLLSGVERRLFDRLSTFAGSWSLEAAATVCGGHGIDGAAIGDLSRRWSANRWSCWRPAPAATSGTVCPKPCATTRTSESSSPVRPIGCASVTSGSFTRSSGTHCRFSTATVKRRTSNTLRVEEQNLRAALAHGLSSPALAQEGVELASALFFYWTKRGLFDRGTLLARTGSRGGRAGIGTWRAR